MVTGDIPSSGARHKRAPPRPATTWVASSPSLAVYPKTGPGPSAEGARVMSSITVRPSAGAGESSEGFCGAGAVTGASAASGSCVVVSSSGAADDSDGLVGWTDASASAGSEMRAGPTSSTATLAFDRAPRAAKSTTIVNTAARAIPMLHTRIEPRRAIHCCPRVPTAAQGTDCAKDVQSGKYRRTARLELRSVRSARPDVEGRDPRFVALAVDAELPHVPLSRRQRECAKGDGDQHAQVDARAQSFWPADVEITGHRDRVVGSRRCDRTAVGVDERQLEVVGSARFV